MFEDDKPSHWFRKLVLIGIGAAIAYYIAQSRAKKQSAQDAYTANSNFRPTTPAPAPKAPFVKPVVKEPVPEEIVVVDVTEEEFKLTDSEYVLEEDEINEDTEIDLALEEDIENGDIDEDDEEEFEVSDEEDGLLEGVLAETDDEDEEEQLLEPSPAAEEPVKWVHPVNGECPPGYPIKARFSTGRYHIPGDRGFEKITPDCCYETVEDAEADGFTHSRWS